MRISAQTTRPAAIRPGNNAGPTFCPAICGNDGTCTSTAIPRISRTAPKIASLNFIPPNRATGPQYCALTGGADAGSTRRVITSRSDGKTSFGHAERLHHRPHVGVTLRHVLRESVLRCPSRAEAALREEVVIFLAVVGFFDRRNKTRLDVFRQSLRCRETAPCSGCPAASRCLLDRRQVWIQRGRLVVEDRE